MEKFYDIHNVFDASFLKHRHISNLVYKKPDKPHNIRWIKLILHIIYNHYRVLVHLGLGLLFRQNIILLL